MELPVDFLSLGRGSVRTEVATHNLLRGLKNMVATKINITGNINDVTT